MELDKTELVNLIKIRLSEKIDNLERLISETRAANNETKSSMGDKYETTREMVQQEINNLQVQLNEVIKQKDFLKTISTKKVDKAEKGALVKTEKGLFYISVSLGELKFGGQKIFAISPESPFALAVKGKIEGEKFTLNQITSQIISVA